MRLPHLTAPFAPPTRTARRPLPQGRLGGFTRVELGVVVAVVTVVALVGLAAVRYWGEARQTGVCRGNLKTLHQAMGAYAADHHGVLPPAAVTIRPFKPASWDVMIKDYIRPNLLVANSVAAERVHDRAIAHLFRCSRDLIERSGGARPRSYAMPKHDMAPANWPPGAENATGVGLWWVPQPAAQPPTNHTHPAAFKPPPPKRLPALGTNGPAQLRWASVADPQDTLLLTENIRQENVLWKVPHAAISTTEEQLAFAGRAQQGIHRGKFNYLMVDGHVETLLPELTVGHVGESGGNAKTHMGIWTIRAGD